QANGTLWSLEGLIQIFISLQYSVENQLDYILDYLISLNSKETFDDDLSILQVKFD
ncbi:MAG: hypothetical protein RLZZ86_3793, partial [Cyanobacteriota bacterium]